MCKSLKYFCLSINLKCSLLYHLVYSSNQCKTVKIQQALTQRQKKTYFPTYTTIVRSHQKAQGVQPLLERLARSTLQLSTSIHGSQHPGWEIFLLTSCIHLSPALQCASHLGHIYTFSPMTAADCSFPARISFQKDWLTGSSLFTFWKKNIPRSRSSYFQSSKNSRDIKKTKLTSCHWSQTLWQGERRLRPWCRLSGFIPRGAVFKRSPWVSEKLDTRLLGRALQSRCVGWRVPSIVVLQQQPTRKTREALKNEQTGNGRKRMFSHMVATSTWLLVTHSM